MRLRARCEIAARCAFTGIGSGFLEGLALFLAASPLLLLSPHRLWAQSTWDEYKPGTVFEIITRERTGALANTHGIQAISIVSGDRLRVRSRVVYTGKSRSITTDHFDILHRWRSLHGLPDSVDSLFKTECLFREGTLQIWLPIQENVLRDLSTEVKVGQTVTILVGYLGALRRDSTLDWVFVVNEYDSPPR